MNIKSMRDSFFEELFLEMSKNDKIIIITVDFGAPILDTIRENFPNQFINVGIAEQNAINIGVGLALEGFIVYIYGIAPFISMRCYEQIRVNMAILSQFRDMNINIIAVGAGMSYATSGPTHHCLEDLSIMRTLPNIEIFSPSDYILSKKILKKSIDALGPKYIRFDAGVHPAIYSEIINLDKGFEILQEGENIAVISTSYMINYLYQSIDELKNIKLIDLYSITNYDVNLLKKELNSIDTIITIEEGFIAAGGLDSEINFNFRDKKIINLGIN
ncbi:transketolase family protein, partial [Campylobacter jejuni]